MLGFTFFLVLFGFPETKWHRMHPDELRMMQSEATSGSPYNERVAGAMVERADPEKVATLPGPTSFETSQRDPWLHKGIPSKGQFKLFQPNEHPFQSILFDLLIPIKLFAFPIVGFASFIVSWSASCFLTLNLTQSQVFGQPPYGFSSEKIGFFNFATLVGALIGLVTAGPLSDWISMNLTMRNKGIREPEMRLLTMIPYVIIMIIGNFVVAFGCQRSWDWKVSYRDLFRSMPLLTSSSGDSDRRIWMCRPSSRRPPRHCIDICRRLIQTSRRIHIRQHHRQ